MADSETIQGLERGLRVLEALAESSSASLHELHATTGFSKPSLLRILGTLVGSGYVVRRVADRRYRISAFSRVGKKPDRHDRVVEAAGPVLDRLCRKVFWPSDLLVPAGDHMERRETSQRQSPFFPHPGHRDRLGQRVGWLMTGVGRAYLAFCPEQERTRIVTRLQRSEDLADRLARHPHQLQQVLEETRQRGYGTRDRSFTGGPLGQPLNDHLAAIAVPLLGRRHVHGSINLLWVKTAFAVEDFATRHLGDLQAAAREIVTGLESPERRGAQRA